jgi:hypothetical protein
MALGQRRLAGGVIVAILAASYIVGWRLRKPDLAKLSLDYLRFTAEASLEILRFKFEAIRDKHASAQGPCSK